MEIVDEKKNRKEILKENIKWKMMNKKEMEESLVKVVSITSQFWHQRKESETCLSLKKVELKMKHGDKKDAMQMFALKGSDKRLWCFCFDTWFFNERELTLM